MPVSVAGSNWAMRLLCICGLLLAQGCSASNTFEAEVIAVSDGDSLRVLDSRKKRHTIRLAHIDAPERGMPFGTAARKALSERVYRHTVQIQVIDTDRYGRSVALVMLDGQDVNYLQLREGWAWHYKKYARKAQNRETFQAYADAENSARSAPWGLWQDKRAQPPWQWRYQQRTSAGVDDNVDSPSVE